MHAIRIDRSKPLCDEPNCGHNRYHPDIAPAAEIGEGEEIALETLDALDGQITPTTTVADFATIDAGPHVKVLVRPEDAALAGTWMRAVPGVLRVIECAPGEGARVVGDGEDAS